MMERFVNSRLSVLLLALALFSLTLSLSGVSGSSWAQFAPTPVPAGVSAAGQIAFASFRDGNDEIYVVTAVGSNPRNLTGSSAEDSDLAWQPMPGAASRAWTDTPISTATPTPPGDMGFCTISGTVSVEDGGTLRPLSKVEVRYEHYSYIHSGSSDQTVTDDNGYFSFAPVLIHDTDSIIVQAEFPGYESQRIMQGGVDTWPSCQFDFLLIREVFTSTPSSPAALATPTRNADWMPLVQDFDGVEMVRVPAGCFMMGSTYEQMDEAYHQCEDEMAPVTCDPVWFLVEESAHEVCFDQPFWIDRTEVTNAQFAAFNGQSAEASAWTGANEARNVISWSEARDFCAQRGGRLSTEAEWEYAARGPEGWVYPWGNEFAAENVVYTRNFKGQPVAVGSKPGGVSWVGALDMSGNVAEWVADWYAPYSQESQINPTGPASGEDRLLRGGSWYHTITGALRSAFRERGNPDIRLDFIGFRCVRSAEN